MTSPKQKTTAFLLAALFAAHAAASPEDTYLRGLVQERFGKPADALSFYEAAVRMDPEARFLHESIAALCLRIDKPERALEAARRVAALAPEDAAARILLGRVELSLGNRRAAMAAFDEALRLSPEDPEALLYAAYARSSTDPGGAIAFYRRYLESVPRSSEAWSRIAQLQEGLGDRAAAEKSWRAAAELDANDPGPLLALGRLAEQRGDLEGALAFYEEARFLFPRDPSILLSLGETYSRLNRGDAAREVFESLLSRDPGNVSAHFGLALLCEAAADWTGAVRHMAAVWPRSDEPGVPLRLSFYHLQAGDPRRSLEVLSAAHRRFPANPDFMAYLAMAHQEAGHAGRALRWWRRAAAAAPERADFQYRAAVAWDARGRFGRAEPLLEKAISLDPRHAAALNYLGYSWVDRGRRLSEALSLIDRALLEDPENLAFLDSKAWALFKLGRLEDAENLLTRIAPAAADAVVWEHKGDVLAALGRTDEARRAWEEGILLAPKSRSLKKKLGGAPAEEPLAPLTAARATLKRLEANFLTLRGLAGGMTVELRKGLASIQVEGIFYFAPPRRVRLEILDALMIPQSLAVRNEAGLHVASVQGEAAPVPPGVEAGLDVLSDVFSGAVFKKFDDPSVRVKRVGSRLTYTGPAGVLTLDGAAKSLLSLETPAGVLRFSEETETEGHHLPGSIRFEGPSFTLGLNVRKWRVNPPLDDALFRTPR